MTVVEYDGRIVVVDIGLRFPTADMLGIDLVLPDFAYLRERADDIEAIVITHGHEDHLGALPWVLRELGDDASPPVYGGPLTIAMARSKLDEHKLQRRRRSRTSTAGETLDARPVRRRARPHDALDPRLVRGRARHRARHGADHRRLQVRPDAGRRRARRRLAAGRAGPRGRAAAVRRLDQRRPRRASRRRSRASGRTSRRCSRAARAASS